MSFLLFGVLSLMSQLALSVDKLETSEGFAICNYYSECITIEGDVQKKSIKVVLKPLRWRKHFFEMDEDFVFYGVSQRKNKNSFNN